jgi:hypothetical protein
MEKSTEDTGDGGDVYGDTAVADKYISLLFF